jgi:hypothetical protein
MPVYSVVTPATSSLSASGMSKGMRFDSASIASMNSANAGMPRKNGQTMSQWVLGLEAHDRRQVHRTGEDDRHERREQQRHFVGDRLRDRAHAAEQRELVVAPPPRGEDRQHRHRADREHVQDADVDVGHHHVGRERDHSGRADGAQRRERRRELEQGRVRLRRPNVLLLHQLDRVGDGLQQSGGTDDRGSQPRLHARRELALEPQRERGDGEDHVHEHDRVQGRDEDAVHRSTSPMIGSSEPRIATASLTVPPGRM